MRLRTTLLHVAVLLTAGCGGSTSNGGGEGDAATPDGKGGTDAVAKDGPVAEAGEAGEPAEAACGGCNCGQPQNPSGEASPQQACELAAAFQGVASGSGTACNAYCQSINADAGSTVYFCTLPAAYITAYDTAAGDSGASGGADAGADAGLQCPAWTGTVLVECSYQCLGRRTAGIAEPTSTDGTGFGEVLAGRAYLEEVSVHAFARLERELAAHGAPATLLRDARRARRDEVRHTAMMTRLARAFGAMPRSPEAPGAPTVRSLLEIAVENAVEGCVRETYGAVIGLIEARRSTDARVRRAMSSIGADECRHAELAWAVARWVMPRLDSAGRAQVRQAARAAMTALAREGDARVVAMLDDRVWGRAA